MAGMAWRALAETGGRASSNRAQIVLDAFAYQAEACENLGSSFMGILCRLVHQRLTDNTAIGRLVLSWPGDPSPSKESVPLRFCGALHALVLTGRDKALADAYPPNVVDPQRMWSAVEAALQRHADFIEEWMRSPPQTNEVRRSSALYAGLVTIAAKTQLPLRLMELGASAGLNLICDAYGYRLGALETGRRDSDLVLEPEWRGISLEAGPVAIESRHGCDLNPLDVHDAQDRLRLMAYLWADQNDRLERTRIAIAAARSGDFPFDLARQDAAGWLAAQMKAPAQGVVRVVMHSIAWQYFPGDAQETCRRIIEQAGAAADPNSPLAWLSMEADGKPDGAALTLRFWPGDLVFDLGRADFHGRWIDWQMQGNPAI